MVFEEVKITRDEVRLPVAEAMAQAGCLMTERQRGWAVRYGHIRPDGRRVRLAAMRIGGRYYCSPQAVERYLAALNDQLNPARLELEAAGQ